MKKRNEAGDHKKLMPRLWRRAAIVMLLTPLGGQAASELKVVADPWCPVSCQSGQANLGYFLDYLSAILKPHDINVRYINRPWSRALEEARKNDAHALGGALKSDAPDFIFPKVSFGNQRTCFFVASQNPWTYAGEASLKKLRLGVTKDYTYGPPLDAYIQSQANNGERIDFVSGSDVTLRSLKKLQASRIDVFVDDETVVNYLLVNQAPDSPLRSVKSAGCLPPLPLYIAFGPHYPDAKKIVKIIEEDWPQFTRSKSYTEIKARYHLK